MKKHYFKVLAVCTVFLFVAATVFGQSTLKRPDVVKDFELVNVTQSQDIEPGNETGIDSPVSGLKAGALSNLQAGADRLVETQYTDGGWGWPLTAPPTYGNILGPIAMGLAQAYVYTMDTDHATALTAAGGYLLTKINNFSPSDGYLANMLDQVFGGTTYRDHLNTYFYGPLAAGTYDKSGGGVLYSTSEYIQLIHDARNTQGIGNLAAWDIGMGLVGAASCGVTGTELDLWIAGVKAEINLLDGNAYYDVIGLAGAIYSLAYVGEDFDPTSGEHAAANNINDLADILASYQIDMGGFTWNSDYVIPNDGNETIQETAYAMLALYEVNACYYLPNLDGALAYLLSVQLTSGGWENYVGSLSGENNEVTAEALWAIATMEDYPTNPNADAGDDVTIYYGYAPAEEPQLDASGGVTYSWSPTDGLSDPNIADPTVTFSGFFIDYPKVYTVTVTDADGCVGTDDVTVYAVDVRCGKKMDKVLICHIPNGNPDKSKTLCISPDDVQDHLNHGDYLGECMDKSSEIVEISESFSVNAYPNPLNKVCNIELTLNESSRVIIQLTDLLGRTVGNIYDGELDAGEHSFVWRDTETVSNSSIYFLNVATETGSKTFKLMTR